MSGSIDIPAPPAPPAQVPAQPSATTRAEGGTQASLMGSMATGLTFSPLLGFLYKKITHDPEPLPTDVANEMLAAVILGAHGLQVSVLWWLNNRKKP